MQFSKLHSIEETMTTPPPTSSSSEPGDAEVEGAANTWSWSIHPGGWMRAVGPDRAGAADVDPTPATFRHAPAPRTPVWTRFIDRGAGRRSHDGN